MRVITKSEACNRIADISLEYGKPIDREEMIRYLEGLECEDLEMRLSENQVFLSVIDE